MPSNTTEIILAREAERAQALNSSIMDAVMSAVVLCSNISEVEEVMPKAIADALGVIVKAWRDEAAERLGRSPLPRGAKTAADKSEYAAGLLAAVGIHLRPFNPFAGVPLTANASAAHAAAQGAIAVAEQLDTPVAATAIEQDIATLGGACGALGVFEWGNTYCTIESHGAEKLHFSAETLAEWASSGPPKGEPKLELACGVPHTFMPDSPCALLLNHDGDHYREGVGTWSAAYLRARGCAAEICGGSSLDPCADSLDSAGGRHSGDLARPGLDEQCRGYEHNEQTDVERWCLLVAFHKGNHSDGESGWLAHPVDPACACDGECGHCVMMGCEACCDSYAGDHGARPVPALPIPEIFPNQCASQLGAERCMMPTAHTSQHIGTKGGKWNDEQSDLVASMKVEIDPVPLGEVLAPPSGPERIVSLTPAGEKYVGELLVKGAEAAGRAIADVVGGVAQALTGVTAKQRDDFDAMSIGEKLVATGAFSSAAAAAVELEVEQAKAVALTGPPVATHVLPGFTALAALEAAHDAGLIISAPPAVSAAWTPPVLDVRRMTWAELSQPPANAATLRPAHRSISQLTTYEDCSLKYRLQRYGETVSVPTWALVGGAAIHEVIEQGESSSPKWMYRSADMWREIFKTTIEKFEKSSGIDREVWITANGGRENEQWWAVEGANMIANYLAWRKQMLADGWGLVAIELEVRTPATDGQPERLGYVDQVWWHHATGRMLLPDLKSGRNKPKGVIQLDTYGRMVGRVGAGVVKPEMIKSIEAGYLMLRRGELVMRDFVDKRTQAEEIDFRFANMDRAERAGIYTPNVGMLCESCTVRAACPVGRPAA